MVFMVSPFLSHHQNSHFWERSTTWMVPRLSQQEAERRLPFLMLTYNKDAADFLPVQKIFFCISPQAISMHMEVKLLIWENNQEISWVEENTNM